MTDASDRVQKGSYIPVKSNGKRDYSPPTAYGEFKNNFFMNIYKRILSKVSDHTILMIKLFLNENSFDVSFSFYIIIFDLHDYKNLNFHEVV